MRRVFPLLLTRSRLPIVVGACGLLLIGLIFCGFYAGMRPDKNLMHILKQIPPIFRVFLGGQHVNLFSAGGFLAMNFKHPLALLAFCSVVVSIASRVPAGEVGTGMMDVVLSHSVRRSHVVAGMTAVLWLAAALVVIALYCGHTIGVALLGVPIDDYSARFVPVVVHGIAFVGFMGMMSLAISAHCSRRGRAVGITIAIICAFLLAEFGSSLWKPIAWMKWGNPFAYYEPTKVIAAGAAQWRDVGALVGGAIALGLLALWRFSRRQIP